MSYCINPWCENRVNPSIHNFSEDQLHQCCRNCGTPLLVQGRYCLVRPLRELDEWEASEIFEVDDLGQPKVMKLLKQEIFLPHLEREAKALQQLDHLGIPKVEADGCFTISIANRQIHCLVMEKIQGVNLDKWLQKHGTIDQSLAINWLSQLVELLKQIHAEDLFHRDIKLSNIMLRPNGQLALIDFGTVRPVNTTYLAKISGNRDITSVVSSGYTPLEQINGKAVPQSDFYALGRTMVYLLTGKHPIDIEEDEATGRLKWRKLSVQPLSNWFVQLLDSMMDPFPGQRPLNADAVMTRLIKQDISVRLAIRKHRTLSLLIVLNIVMIVFNLVVGIQWNKSKHEYRESLQQLSRLPSDCGKFCVSSLES